MHKEQLIHVFAQARKGNHKFVIVHLFTPAGREFIVIPADSFDKKEEFYMNAYNDNLVHVMNEKVYIKGLSFGDSSELDHIG